MTKRRLPVKVLVAEDDPMVCSLHVQTIQQVRGFSVAGTVGDGMELLRFFESSSADLIVMDIFMPRLSGLDALKKLRAEGNVTDVILVSAGKNPQLVSQAKLLGAFDYMIKPYSLKRFRTSLEAYLEHRTKMPADTEEATQDALDTIFEISSATQSPGGSEKLPKGLQPGTLSLVMKELTDDKGLSAEEICNRLSISRSTAWRYLDHLSRTGAVKIQFEYNGPGRPLKRYILRERVRSESFS